SGDRRGRSICRSICRSITWPIIRAVIIGARRRFVGVDVVYDRAVVRVAADVGSRRAARDGRRGNGFESKSGGDQRVAKHVVPPRLLSGSSRSGKYFVF